jgi:hypothetical protein
VASVDGVARLCRRLLRSITNAASILQIDSSEKRVARPATVEALGQRAALSFG